MSAPTRRDVLACLACACAAACVGVPGGDDTADTADTGADPVGVEGGTTVDYAVGDLEPVGHGVAVGRDALGFFALSTICTHRGCDMATRGEVDGAGLSCDCHGSRFRIDGTVSRGPATRPLPFYAVSIATDGSIVVDKGTEADPEDRAEAPISVG